MTQSLQDQVVIVIGPDAHRAAIALELASRGAR